MEPHMEQQEVGRRRPRSSQACKPCRALKTRCVPSGESDKCERCLKFVRECVWAEDHPRSKRIRLSESSQTAQIKQKIDGLVAVLAQYENERASPTVREGFPTRQASVESAQEPYHAEQLSAFSPSPRVDEERQDYAGSKNPRRSSSIVTHQIPAPMDSQERSDYDHHDKNIPTAESTTAPTIEQDKSRLNHPLVKDVIDTTCGNALLNEYRLMADWFPFVVISPDIAAQDLAMKKPLLFLAICMTACGKIRLLQSTLEVRYRNELALKAISNAHRSLDCLQSILVYLAWYHLHFDPNRQQINQLLHIANAMAFDLGISESPKKASPKMSPHDEGVYSSLSEERESRRALLGCFYLSATFTVILNIPNSSQLSEYMTDCYNCLQAEREFPSDTTLPHMIRSAQLGDQTHMMLKSGNSDKFDAENFWVRMHLKLLQSQLKGLKTEGRLNSNNRAIMDLSHNYISMELHSVGLRKTPSSSRDEIHSAPSSTDTFHLDLLLSCLQAAKAYLDTLLAISATHYRLLSFVEWMRLLRVLAIICKLCVPSNNYTDIHWDFDTAQERVRVDLYLESLCYRLQSLTTFDKTSQPLPDFWIVLKTLLDRIRSWYIHKIRSSTEGATTATDADILPLGPATRQQVFANGYEAVESAEDILSTIPKLAEMDRMMNDLESPFCASNLFDVLQFKI